MLKKILKMLGAASLTLLLLLFSVPALAEEAAGNADTIDWDKTGTISVTPKSASGDHLIVKGTGFALYRVADIDREQTTLSYTLTDDFAESQIDLSDLTADGLALSFADYAAGKGLSGLTQSADEQGTVRFSDLELGLYLLVQTDTPKGAYAANPFLVSVPMTSESGTDWLYEVDASPKAEVYELVDISVKKVWSDGASSSRPGSVTVTLYRGEEELETATLSEENGWTYTWTELQKSDEYSVREDPVEGYTASYSQDEFTFTVTNTSPNLPQTGQLNWPIPLLAGCGLALIAVGLTVYAKARKRDS